MTGGNRVDLVRVAVALHSTLAAGKAAFLLYSSFDRLILPQLLPTAANKIPVSLLWTAESHLEYILSAAAVATLGFVLLWTRRADALWRLLCGHAVALLVELGLQFSFHLPAVIPHMFREQFVLGMLLLSVVALTGAPRPYSKAAPASQWLLVPAVSALSLSAAVALYGLLDAKSFVASEYGMSAAALSTNKAAAADIAQVSGGVTAGGSGARPLPHDRYIAATAAAAAAAALARRRTPAVAIRVAHTFACVLCGQKCIQIGEHCMRN
jgi:hypothetical protein